MNIYFSGSIRGGRDDVDIYNRIISYLKKYGNVLTEHIGDNSLNSDGENKKVIKKFMIEIWNFFKNQISLLLK